MNVIYHKRLTREVALHRFQVYCEEPMLFHCLHYCTAVHQDSISKTLAVTRTPEMLWHKVECLRLLQEALTQIDDAKLEIVICTVTYLVGFDLQEIASAHELPFVPHPWIHPWGAGGPWIVNGQRLPTKPHVDALQALVKRKGGLNCLQYPGLGLSIARTDLVYASINLEKPRHPCVWIPDDETARACRNMRFRSAQAAGQGFASIAGSLPPELLDAVLNAAATDLILSRYEYEPLLDPARIEILRCATQYRLLALPKWTQLQSQDNLRFDEKVYESCRLTAILYSNAVVLALPPHTGWHLRLCVQIRQLLRDCDMTELSRKAPGLLIWTLFIAALAAHKTPDHGHFVSLLRPALVRESLWTRSATEQVLEQFLWARKACGHAVEDLWAAVGMGGQRREDMRETGHDETF